MQVLIEALDAQSRHVQGSFLAGSQLGNDFTGDGGQRDTQHAMAGGDDDIVVTRCHTECLHFENPEQDDGLCGCSLGLEVLPTDS